MGYVTDGLVTDDDADTQIDPAFDVQLGYMA
jgi:hypothetical protein